MATILDRLLDYLFVGRPKRPPSTWPSARAIISAIEETASTAGGQPVCTLTLMVHPTGGPSFEGTTEQMVGPLEAVQLQPGAEVTVKYDPAERGRVEITALGYVSISPAEASRMADDSAELEKRLNLSGTAADGIVTSFQRTGVHINGDSPLTILGVKVLPTGQPPFDSQVIAVCKASGLGKFQPGQEVHVRFDPADRQWVSFDLSRTQNTRT